MVRENLCYKTPWMVLSPEYRQCIRMAIDTTPINQLWNSLRTIVEGCSGQLSDYGRQRLLVNKDDVKVAILSSNIEDNCIVVTLGVGDDILSEQQLLKLQPRCQFFGADPMPEFGRIYSTIGRYFQIAVAHDNINYNASVLVELPMKYEYRQLKAIGIIQFLLEKVQRNRIDHLWIDNEGPEYELLKVFTDAKRLIENDIHICQLNIELHAPLENYGITIADFQKTFRDFTYKSPFVLMHVDMPNGGAKTYLNSHHRVFLVNYLSDFCIKRYFEAGWCNRI